MVIVGQGLVGSLMLQVARANGRGRLVAVDALPMRCAQAAELEADEVINAADEDPVARVLELTDGNGADVVIYAVGGRAGLRAFDQAQRMTARGGLLQVVGLYEDDPLPLSSSEIQRKRLIGGALPNSDRGRGLGARSGPADRRPHRHRTHGDAPLPLPAGAPGLPLPARPSGDGVWGVADLGRQLGVASRQRSTSACRWDRPGASLPGTVDCGEISMSRRNGELVNFPEDLKIRRLGDYKRTLRRRIQRFELRYEMTTERMLERTATGELRETAEISRWQYDADELADLTANGGEKHGWLWFDRYQLIHREVLANHPFIVKDRTQFVAIPGSPDRIRCIGLLLCRSGIEIEVDKRLNVRTIDNRLQVRGSGYRYHARIRGRGFGRSGQNVLRYDSGHAHTPGVYHRHRYDLETGEDRLTTLGREEFPVLSEMVDELAAMFPDAK